MTRKEILSAIRDVARVEVFVVVSNDMGLYVKIAKSDAKVLVAEFDEVGEDFLDFKAFVASNTLRIG